jgi:hypothetical protein
MIDSDILNIPPSSPIISIVDSLSNSSISIERMENDLIAIILDG